MNNTKEDNQTKRLTSVFTLPTIEQSMSFDIRVNEGSMYPSIYLRYKAVNPNSKDRVKSIISATGCRNLQTGVTGVYNDVEHNDFFSGRKDTIVSRNAGQVVDIEIVDDILYGTSRIGKEHNVLDKKGTVIGSSYANAWLTVAQDKVRSIGGDISEHIPSHIWQEFFVGKNPVPYKNVSIEMAYNNYDDQNAIRFDGVELINVWDLVRVSFLTDSVAGQQDSAFVSYDIRSIKNQNNNPNMENLIKTIRCICDAKVGDMIMDNATGLIYELLAINDDGSFTVMSVDDNTEMNVSKMEAENFDMVDDTIRKVELSPQTRAYIRMCMSCQKNKKPYLMENKDNLRIETPLAPNAVPTDELTMLRADIEALKALVEGLASKQTINPTRSIDLPTLEDVAPIVETIGQLLNVPTDEVVEPTKEVEEDEVIAPIEEDKEVEPPSEDVIDTDVSADVTDLQDEINSAIRSYKPFNYQPIQKSTTGFKTYKK
jgi:hypothetical protein